MAGGVGGNIKLPLLPSSMDGQADSFSKMVSAKMRKVEIQTANHRTDYRLVAFGPPAATAVAAVTGVRNYLLSRHNSSYSPFFWVADIVNLTHLTCILTKFYVVVVPDKMHYLGVKTGSRIEARSI